MHGMCACQMVRRRQEVPGRFHLSVVTYQSFLESADPLRRWPRVLSSLAMQTLLTWPFGVRPSLWKEHRGSGGACPAFGGPALERECESSEGLSASFLSPVCWHRMSGCHSCCCASPPSCALQQPRGGAGGQPCTESRERRAYPHFPGEDTEA